MKSSMFPSAHQSHPYSQKLNLQLHRKVPLFIIWAGASLLFPKSLNLQQGRLGPGDSAKQTHDCGNRLVQNISNSSTHTVNTLPLRRQTTLPAQSPYPAHKYYCTHITVYKMTLGIFLIGNARPPACHRLELSCWRPKWDTPHVQKTWEVWSMFFCTQSQSKDNTEISKLTCPTG